MSFAKYYEDNIDIIEERILLNSKSEYELPDYSPLKERIVQKTYIVTSTVIEKKKQRPQTQKYRTRVIKCCNCGNSFNFTGGEQHYYEEKKLFEPKHCPACRKKRNEYFNNMRRKEYGI